MNFTIPELKEALHAARWLSQQTGETPTALAIRDSIVSGYVEYNSEYQEFITTVKYEIANNDLNN